MVGSLSPIKEWAKLRPFSLAVKSQDVEYTWAELVDQVDSVAASLASQGIKSGEVLTCVGKNSLDMLLVYLGCMELGVICAPVMPQTKLCFEAKLKVLYSRRMQVKVWCTPPNSALMMYSNVKLESSSNAEYLVGYHQDKPASIIFTSGSTGVPKAVVHTSRQHLASAAGLLEKLLFTYGDTWLLSLPIYHVSGLAIVYRWLFSGATLKIASGDLQSDLSDVTHASFVATQLQRAVENDILSGLTHVLLGGSHIPLSLCEEVSKRGIDTWVGYGMTEAASTVTVKLVDGSDSSGQVLNKRRVKLQDERIYIAGEILASGYYYQGNIEPLTYNGWFDTKDLGLWQNGGLHIIGRADNLFISGGENIHCEEIEAVLNKIPHVIQAIVVPVEDKEFGHRPVAVIQSEFNINIADIEQNLSTKLVKFKWPVAYYKMPENFYLDEIKISRQAVSQWAYQHRAQSNYH
ncbi:o-succinylbenzoate--CoA ligase [Vibrio pectenicida]|uniref:O-succinylbenzoate--CoA ligase n=1 Tax=Vibrio pectenicida TaxID=62763 RepID=A0A3R9L1J1_9VIBR|nr:o-succinylbenzoate--CoA ligase [Vibrio pectenicida]RSD30925.1 o-succinylbenzoate--CoA ligase [Vibrio pectenicida]